MTNIIITGSNGRMGEALSRCATHHAGLNVVGTIDMGDDLGSIIDQGDVIIDFSFHEVTLPFASFALNATRGWSSEPLDIRRKIGWRSSN